MATKPLPSQEALRQLLDYDPETGALTWRERGPEFFRGHKPKSISVTWNKRHAGNQAGSISVIGYVALSLVGQQFHAHRIIWKMMHGEDAEEVDHINGDRSDNRLANLRSVPKSENAKNKRKSKRNSSGCTGVAWSKNAGKWIAEIQCSGVREYLGCFDRLEDAKAARKLAEMRLGFHENHGV